MKGRNGGYAGLLMLVLSIAVIGFWFLKEYLSPAKQNSEEAALQPLTASGTTPETQTKQMHADIDAAKAAQYELNAHNADLKSGLGQ